MEKEVLLKQLTSDDKYIGYCKKILKGNSLFKDLFQDFLLQILEYPDDKFRKIDCPDCFVFKILSNMVFSHTSPFFYKYKKKVDEKEFKRISSTYQYDYAIDEKAAIVNKTINNLYWYDKKILHLWLNGKSIRVISKEKHIPLYSIQKTLNKTRNEIKKNIKMHEIGGSLKVLLVCQRNKTALQHYRQYRPHERLMKTNSEFDIQYIHGDGGDANIDGMTDEQLREFHIIYYLRQISYIPEKVDSTVERLRKLGLKIILDIDDYWQLPHNHHWRQLYGEKKVAENTINALKKVDWVITTTSYFADKIKEFNPHVTVIPNCISPDESQFEIRKIESEKIRFGWIGGVFHLPDIEEIKSNFKFLNELYKNKDISDKFQISVGGFNCNYEYKEIEKTFTANYSFKNSDATYYNYLQQCTPAMDHISLNKSYRRLWGRDIENYGQLYNEIDVALIPLRDNVFNKCKSELKIVEAGWMKKTVICSDMLPYNQWIKNGENGFLVKAERNNIDWYLQMKKLIFNPNLIQDMGKALHETIKKNFDMDKHNVTRTDLYKSLLV